MDSDECLGFLAGLWMGFTSYTSLNLVFVGSFKIDKNPTNELQNDKEIWRNKFVYDWFL